MIKSIEIQNMFGINEKQTLNFEASELKPNQIMYDSGVVSNKKNKILLSPTLLAKNATGKTSILRAINFIGKINNINDLLEQIWPFEKERIIRLDEELSRNFWVISTKINMKQKLNSIQEIRKFFMDRIANGPKQYFNTIF